MSLEDAIHDDLLLDLVAELLASGREASFIVRGGSMHPVIRNWDKVVVRPCGASELKRGMVALCVTDLPDGGRGMLVHRFLGCAEDGAVRLQGDNCPSPDPPLPSAAVIGRVVEVRRGRWTFCADRPLGAFLLRRTVGLPRALAYVARARGILTGRAPLPRVFVPPGRLARERFLMQIVLADEEALLTLDASAGPLQLAPNEEELLPLFMERARRSSLDPSCFGPRARSMEMTAAWRSAKTEAALRWVHDALAAAGETLTLVKGAALAASVYPAPHCRPMADVDALAAPDRKEAAVEALLAAGASLAEPEYPLSFYYRFKNEVALRLPGIDWPVLEIHWRGPSSPWYNRRGDPSGFHKDARPGSWGKHLLMLSPEAEFAYILMHMAKHFPLWRLMWAADLLLLTRTLPDWDAIHEHLRAQRIVLPAAVACRWLAYLAPGQLPDRFVRALSEEARGVSRLIDRAVFSHQANSRAGKLIELCCQPDWRTRLAFARMCLFPSRRILERMFPEQSGASLCRLHVLRLARLVRLRS